MDSENLDLVNPLVQFLRRIPRKSKRLLMLIVDSMFMPFALWCAIALHFGSFQAPLASNLWLYLVTVVMAVPIFIKLGLYRAIVRFMGGEAVAVVFTGVIVLVSAFGFIVNFLSPVTIPIGALSLFAMFGILYVGGSRFAARSLMRPHRLSGERVAIYGTGEAGVQLASALIAGRKFLPVAFFDDSVSLRGGYFNGIEVLSPEILPEVVKQRGISRILLAIPSASRRTRRKIIERLEELPVYVQTMPDMGDIVSGETRVDEVRDIDVADLLGRDAVPPDESLLDACIAGKIVMVTGAGGSIGSELCRQILIQKPKSLLLVDSGELALYNIHKELAFRAKTDGFDVEIVPLLGFVQKKLRMLSIMKEFGVQTVYHAAAYKHVPMVEQNVCDGIANNALGTLASAEAAMESNVETFVLISTDKAVCPTNVMGASKRLAEIVLQGLDQQESNTCFCLVRFGNVLASSGSVVPLFQEQIARGGPVTVTHPEIIRYFMTIPEAAQLVIQAGSMGRGGDVFLLDMGKPVRIEDLARRMIHLHGLTVLDEENPDGDIEIKYTGLRPAEKLYEELSIGNNIMGTDHPMIMRALEKSLTWDKVTVIMQELEGATSRYDSVESLRILRHAVEEYSPTEETSDLVLAESHRDGKRDKEPLSSNVSFLSKK